MVRSLTRVLLIIGIVVLLTSAVVGCKGTREGLVGGKQVAMRTCYPTGSADVSNCFEQPSVGAPVQGTYITAAKVGNKPCPWGNGGDPDYWKIMKQKKKDTGMSVWGLVNMTGGDPIPSWPAVKNCLTGGTGVAASDPRKGLFDGLLIDAEGLSPSQCKSISDLSALGVPTASVVGSGTCQFRNPLGHSYIGMCYDGADKVPPCSDCSSKAMKGVQLQKFMWSTAQWPPHGPCSNKPADVFCPKVGGQC